MAEGNDVIFLYEEKASEKEIELARKYQLPDSFYLSFRRSPGNRQEIRIDDDVDGDSTTPVNVGVPHSAYFKKNDGEIEADENLSETTISFTIENVSKLSGRVRSPAVMVRDLAWNIKATVKISELNHRFLSFFLQCNGDPASKSWACYAKAELKLLNHKACGKDFTRKIHHWFDSKEYEWGYSNFIQWSAMLDPEAGYVKRDKITLEVVLKADAPYGVTASEAASNKKNNTSNSFPIKVRSFAKKMEDPGLTSSPGKSIHGKHILGGGGFLTPSSNKRNNSLLGSSSTPLGAGGLPQRPGSLKKEGGIKLLDITEMPVGAKEAKRRRKIAEMEAAEQQKKEKEEQKAAAAAAHAAVTSAAPYTPDYAAGLVSPAPSKLSTPAAGPTTSALSTPSVNYIPAATNRLPTTTPTQLTASSQSSVTQHARENQQTLQQQQLQPNPQQIQQPQQQVVKRGLSLTREQMLEAQEMFRTSKKVTRPEKALILGFMAGARENPCPQQGNILSIRLSKNKELVQLPDGSQKPMLVDTFFQMNYLTGEWKRVKKTREADDG